MMFGQGARGRNGRSLEVFLDLLHIGVGIMIVILAVVSFLNPENNLVLFPVIFMLASILNLVNGWVKIRQGGRDKKKQAQGAGLIFFRSCLLALSVISALSIWR